MATKAQNKAYRAANRDRLNAKDAAYRVANATRIQAREAAYYAANAKRVGARQVASGTRYMAQYGINAATARAMRAAQNNRCLGCTVEMTDKMGPRRWVVDHFVDVDGRKVVRGILCSSCNICIGCASSEGHDPVALRRLAEYLEAHGYVKRVVVVGTEAVAEAQGPQLQLLPRMEVK